MGPMLSEQQEQLENNKNNINNIKNIINNKNNSSHEDTTSWNTDNNNQCTILVNNHQQYSINDADQTENNNCDQHLTNNNDYLSHTVRYSSMSSSSSFKLLSSTPTNGNFQLQLSTIDGRTTTAMIEQQQQQQQPKSESLADVKNNYTRRRRRGRLRSPIIADNSQQITSTTSTINDVIAITTAKNINNNNTALTINLDNNVDEEPNVSPRRMQIKSPLNGFVQEFTVLSLTLSFKFKLQLLLLFLGLKLNTLWKLSRYVYMIINKSVLATNKQRRLAANNNNIITYNNSKLNKIRYKNNNRNNKIVKNYIFLIGLCVATTILPLNLVQAASPFQNQKHSNHNTNNNNNHNHHATGAGLTSSSSSSSSSLSSVASGAASSAVLTPSPSFPVSSAASSSETEFLYPSSQSEEGFDDDDASLQYSIPPNETDHDNFTITKTPLFPTDLFTKEQLENGAVICHIIGVIYMFVALAIVCDEFFVPSLDVIIEKLGITDDVAGATFMAAGGSAPELFTSVIGVFVSFDDVGIGTIVGSAVFNILFVIGMCALFSKTVLSLTWWPLFRDCSFYSVSLLILIYFFRDNLIYWWEALVLFSIYLAYVGFMKWNQQVERCVKKVVTKNKVTRVRSTDQLMPAGNAANSSETSMATQPGGSVTSRAASETRSGPAGSSSGATGNSSGGSTQTGAKFRHGLLQLMIHTIDPLHDGKVDEKATQLHAIASLKVLLDATKPQRGGATTSAANHVKINLKETTLADRPNGNIDTTLDSGNEVEDEPEALSMAWPPTARKRLTYVLVAPLLFPMWLTLPDTRTPRGKRFFPVTFIGSIMWIAAYSYLMVWWANVAGDTARIPPEVMGLTFLAAGTSIPDLITSVIVARKGFGDMAVSSSVGSNIFDVTVGLPIPWLLYGIIYDQPVEVNSVGMVCSITILFMMLLFVILSIACFHWRMNRGLGFTMFLLYFVFVAVSLMFEYNIIVCPV